MFGLNCPYVEYEDAMSDMRLWYTMQEAFGLALSKRFRKDEWDWDYASTVRLLGNPGDVFWYPAFQIFNQCRHSLGLELSDIGLTQDDINFIRQRQTGINGYIYWRKTSEGERLFSLARSCFGSDWCYEYLD